MVHFDIYKPKTYLIERGHKRELTEEENKLGGVIFTETLDARIWEEPRIINLKIKK